MSPTIFVVAATGTLGKALALDLRKIDWNVHAVVRDPSSPAAKTLADAGVQLFPGDWDNEKALRDGMAGCDGLFLNLMPSYVDWDADVRQGRSIVAIAKAAGVKHAIYSAGNTASEYIDPNSMVAKFINNKKLIQEAVETVGFEAYTILRPSAFMANFLAPKVATYKGLAETGTFETALRPDMVMPLVDEHDVAAFSIAAFKEPVRFNGANIPVTSETHTTEEILRLLSQATGLSLKANYLSEEEIAARINNEPLLGGQMNSRALHRHYNLEEQRRWGIPVHTFQEFLEREKASLQETYGRLA
ncbi:hypothetical protein GGR55DRAFT_225443 [Xylaria sp. FL0064]|nr:hypothetical protein GGR55DRAFT_225443 [Xylaria sp. FL0064]